MGGGVRLAIAFTDDRDIDRGRWIERETGGIHAYIHARDFRNAIFVIRLLPSQ